MQKMSLRDQNRKIEPQCIVELQQEYIRFSDYVFFSKENKKDIFTVVKTWKEGHHFVRIACHDE